MAEAGNVPVHFLCQATFTRQRSSTKNCVQLDSRGSMYESSCIDHGQTKVRILDCLLTFIFPGAIEFLETEEQCSITHAELHF